MQSGKICRINCNKTATNNENQNLQGKFEIFKIVKIIQCPSHAV